MKKAILLLSGFVGISLMFQNCGVFNPKGASFSSVVSTDSIQGFDSNDLTVVSDDLSSVNDLDLTNNAKEDFENFSGEVVLNRDNSSQEAQCEDNGMVRWETLPDPKMEESPSCLSGKRKVYITHKRKQIICVNGELKDFGVTQDHVEIKTISCENQERSCSGGLAHGQITQRISGETNKTAACPMGFSGDVINMHVRIVNMICNNGELKPLNIQAGAVLSSKNNCRNVSTETPFVGGVPPVEPSNFFNFVAGDKETCEGLIQRRLGIMNPTCRIGGGCGISCGMPGSNCPSANPQHFGACIHPNARPITETLISIVPGGGQEVSCSADPAICRVYDEVLSRTPDQAGAHYWTVEYNKLKAVHGENAAYMMIKNHIASSTEAQGRQASVDERESYAIYAESTQTDSSECLTGVDCANKEEVNQQQYDSVIGNVVEGVYGSVLGRASDSSGKEYWENEAQKMHQSGMSYSQIRSKLEEHFLNSQEYKSK